MLYSMTGYGRGTAASDGVRVFSEAKSVNSRYFELSLHLPTLLSGTDSQFMQVAKKYVNRGRVNLSVQILESGGLSLWKATLDNKLLDTYAELLESIADRLGKGNTTINLDRFLTMNELYIRTPEPTAQKLVLDIALTAANEAMKSLRNSRRQEGKQLQRDISHRIANVKGILKKIRKLHDRYSPVRFKKLRESMEQLTADINVDPIRLAQEVAHIVTKADCTEEIIRLEAHITRMERLIKSKKPVGSVLNFTLQECHREINTIGSKTDIPKVSSLVIDMKEELERIREQVQNIE